MKSVIRYIEDVFSVFAREFTTITRDSGILLIATLAMIIYGFLYSYAYSPEILQKVPVAVVDLDNSPTSRELLRKVGSTQSVDIKYQCSSLEQAKELMINSKVLGILYIERDFDRKILSNQTAYFSVYTDGSYFLAYKQFFLAVAHTLLEMDQQIKFNRYALSGQNYHTAEYLSEPISLQGQFLYNRAQGYGSFLMPAILILIIQQTIIIACGMVWGKSRERGQISLFTHKGAKALSSSAIVLGRSIYYLLNSLVLWLVVTFIIYKVFDLPSNGNNREAFALIVPYALSSAFFGVMLSQFMRYRESIILYFFFSSIPLLFLSGISWPREGMPEMLFQFGRIFPSTSAIDGFIHLQSTGSSLAQISTSYYTLWVLTLLYFVLAIISVHYATKRTKSSTSKGDC